jgi:hypothetical protein
MTHLTSVSRLWPFSAASFAFASACGGNSFTNGGEGGQSGSNPGGGAKNTAGTSSTAGKPNGGGGSLSIAGAGSGGGSPSDPACNAPAVQGSCEAYFERWFHDVTTGLCRPFVYGGCGGNANNYETFEECQKACPGGAPNYDSCEEPADCTLSTGCCGICDGPDISARELTAYNKAFHSELSSCPDIPCAPCPEPLPGQGSLKYFVPDCVQGQCAVVDLRTSELTACETHLDCRLRNGTQCCEGCAPGDDVVAVRNDGSFEKLVCGSEPPACLTCLPTPPPDTAAACNEGHCVATYGIASTD